MRTCLVSLLHSPLLHFGDETGPIPPHLFVLTGNRLLPAATTAITFVLPSKITMRALIPLHHLLIFLLLAVFAGPHLLSVESNARGNFSWRNFFVRSCFGSSIALIMLHYDGNRYAYYSPSVSVPAAAAAADCLLSPTW